MPQFDLLANYYLITIFYILYFIYLISYISVVNTIFKHMKVFLLIAEHKNNFKAFAKFNLELFSIIKGWNVKVRNIIKCH